MNIKKDFGARVKELRNNKNITQAQLAELIEIDPKHMSHIETGRSFPKADLIEKLATALDVEYTDFFQIEHLKTKQDMLNKINLTLKEASKEDLKRIFRIINSYFN